ncbi:MAG: AAA family ATPase, partial [Candidatus Gottesmanbacteria bacterium]|nr:AAA family ATPase [Candidatus Gottesmanbacteria bacterium]
MGKKLVLRDQFNLIRSHVDEPEITVITGPRQVGKTTLIRQIMEDIGNGKTTPSSLNYFNLDVSQDHRLFLRQENVVSFIKNRIPKEGKLYLFIDEI